MVRARLVCSEARCAVMVEVIAPVAEIDALVCDCGCGLELIGWPEALDEHPRGLGVTVESLPI